MSVRVRFAPSPTGHLHVGGARTALYNHLFARRHGGTFVLRIEDTDAERSTAESVEAIFAGLRWLGLPWDEGPHAGGVYGPYVQSERMPIYREALERLKARGVVYPAYESPEELEAMREAQLARGEGARYDGRARELSAAERAGLEAEGRTPAWRFRVPDHGESGWDDIVRERVTFQNALLEDFVLVRSDGLPTYNFACVVDDLGMAITHVIRGDDHISNTPRQLLLYQAFEAEPPRFAHASMILGPDGKRLSKRHGATSVEAFGELGIVPEGMVNFLALLGWAYDGTHELFALDELERAFALERVNPNPAVFDTQKLEWVNAQHLKRLSEPERLRRVSEFLRGRGWDLDGHSPEWLAQLVSMIGERLKTLLDAERYGAFALAEVLEIDPEAWATLRARADTDAHLRALASRLEALAEWAPASLEPAVRGMAAELGLKAGALIGVARVALTGTTTSPGIFEVMALLGRERTLARLSGAATRWANEARSTV